MEEAVKVVQPTAVAKLMGSVEGFGGASGVVVDEAEGLQPDAASSFGVRKVSASSPVPWTMMPDSELHRQASPISSFPNDDTLKDCGFRNITSLSLKPKPEPEPEEEEEDKLLLRKSGKIARNNSGCTKRSRMAQIEVSTCKTGLIDVNGISTELASYPSSRNITEKTQVAKQKNSSNGKRGDKRNGKFPKSRCDSLSLKNGLVSFNSAAGGNNFFGVYGLKPDAFDIKKHIHELSFNELLDGSYNCPSNTKDKGKKAANSNDNLLNSVRKACSVLRLQKAVLAQKCAENENSNSSTGLLIAGSTASQSDGDKEDSCPADLTSSDKESYEEKIKASTSTVDSPLYNPKDILERLALPPPKDLDSLLLDAARPSSASRNNTDPRLGKSLCHRTGLPPFPWSHPFSGHNKSVTDAAKLSSSRTICLGKWVKVKNISSLQEGSTGFLEGLESLTYNPSLVPTATLMSGPPESEVAQITSSEQVLSMSEACSTSKVFPAATEEHPPSHLAAAQMLCEMATYTLKQNPCRVAKLLKKPSQMSMKTCKLKSVKSEKLFASPKPKTGLDNLVKVKVADDGPSKKLRLSADVKNEYANHNIGGSKEPLHRSALQSVKSSPSKLFRESAAETKIHNPNFVKKSCGISPMSRVVDKPRSSSEQKLRKAVPPYWNRADGKM
ncbi:Hypothetical predicted protein [Olea europaea subsp. europaea]|uniref:Uncharacterized protein n=1 Tax=Olea europaea subsp. europaea TaxID=158383 RepID=A0A8S0U2C2_OLEEU|nr:Hypothetical predicted protein [Olea europaea subsp. europaea]